MNVVDSCGWLEVFAGSPRSAVYADLLRDGAALVVPSICIHEVFKVIARQHGEQKALSYVARMRAALVVALDAELALAAGRLALAHGLPLADSIIYATSERHDAELWTHDPHFRGLPGVRFVEDPGEE